MKKIISILTALVIVYHVGAQEVPAMKSFLFENPDAKNYVRIEIGDKVNVWHKSSDVQTTGTILSLTDAFMILSIRKDPFTQVVAYRNVARMKVIPDIPKGPKSYFVWTILNNGLTLSGVLIHATKDSLTLRIQRDFQVMRLGASEIKSVRIRRNRAGLRGLGFGAAAGVILGAIIGYATYTPPDCGHNAIIDFGCNDVGPEGYAIGGALIGGVAGLGIGALIGSAGREFKIDGKQTRFDSFVDDIK